MRLVILFHFLPVLVWTAVGSVGLQLQQSTVIVPSSCSVAEVDHIQPFLASVFTSRFERLCRLVAGVTCREYGEWLV